MWDFFKRTDNANGKYRKPYYSLNCVASGRVLDVAQDGDYQGQTIIWDGYGGENQQFTLKQKGPDHYLKCKKDNLYLTVSGPEDGAKIYAAPKNKSETQRFRLDEREPGSK